VKWHIACVGTNERDVGQPVRLDVSLTDYQIAEGIIDSDNMPRHWSDTSKRCAVSTPDIENDRAFKSWYDGFRAHCQRHNARRLPIEQS